jgi:peroxiredoxin Q/BCP
MQLFTSSSISSLAAFTCLSLFAGDPSGLQEGQKAPAIQAQDQNGKTIKLSDYAGKSIVVLYFYPKDDTPGCTKEACSLRDGHSELKAAGAVVLGVSSDDVKSHEAFAAKYRLPFSLLADPGKTIIKDYGVKMFGLNYAKRVTFVIDRQGVIRKIFWEVKPAGHDQEVLAAVKNLG